ncbi:DUF1778 domain-containing protein [Bradyrhizobium sp. STM 3557]|uniref:type II toxin -antitoxin system TacA 1-like antitoxin n=1 Tax=Bradyrhizobium sp. STM 3557 TaxID=578920 RepID=UPI00388EB80F
MPGRCSRRRSHVRSLEQAASGERLEDRGGRRAEELIERAAALQGLSITDFVLASMQDARWTIDGRNQILLSARDGRDEPAMTPSGRRARAQRLQSNWPVRGFHVGLRDHGQQAMMAR